MNWMPQTAIGEPAVLVNSIKVGGGQRFYHEGCPGKVTRIDSVIGDTQDCHFETEYGETFTLFTYHVAVPSVGWKPTPIPYVPRPKPATRP
jgi:hypothetical protein